MKRCCCAVVFLLLTAPAPAASRGYYRFPAVHENTVVFTAEGDLWKVGIDGGAAVRLTTHLGQETHAAISPDGKRIAFSAEYEGAAEVYVMPVTGGRPKRVTFDGETATIVGWKNGSVVYATTHFSTLPNTQLVIVDPQTRRQQLVPLSQARDGSWDASGTTLFFTRLNKQFSTTKRYKGGWAQKVWKFAAGAKEAVPLTTDYAGTSRTPMWHRGRVYFVTDRDGTLNLWSMHENGKQRKQHTFHKWFDVLSPAMSGGKIVYQHGADLRVFDAATNTDRLIPITLASDFDQTRPRWVKKPMDYLTAYELSPNGDRVALTARGRVFVRPTAKDGRLIEVTRQPGVRYRSAKFLSNGKELIALSDETGEMEFWKLPADGIGKRTPITSQGKIFRFGATPSPDGKRFAYSDKNGRLWVVETATGKQKKIADSPYGEWSNHGLFTGKAWSPDGRWLAYVDAAPNTVDRVFLYEVASGKTRPVTTDRYDSFAPAWSTDGKWLYFLSDRHLASRVRSPWGPLQPEPYFTSKTGIYGVALRKNQPWPFVRPNEIKRSSGWQLPFKLKTAVTVDFQNIERRTRKVPAPWGNYDRLALAGKQLLWVATDESAKPKKSLMTLEIGKRKPVTLVSDVRGYRTSGDGKKVLVRKKDELFVFKLATKPPANLTSGRVDLKGWTFAVDPKEEWKQMFVDAWRMERDYFYDRGLHGRDWTAIRDRHLPLLDRVTDRAELNDLIEQVVGELQALHIFVRGGEHREGTDKIEPASLGAVLSRDEKAGGYRIARIYRTDPDEPEKRSPLLQADVEITEGDVITAINGVPTLSVPHVNSLLRNQAAKQVRLRIRRKKGKPADVVVTPIAQKAAADMRYSDWELSRRQRVEKAAKGKIGYVHLRAMGADNIAEWARNFYPVFNRQGLIIDVRNNRGGNIDSWILGRLLRKAWFYWQPRAGKPLWNMQYAFRGHVVVLCNRKTASDGEAFTEGFRRLKLGKVIGTRTWGGEIWLSFNNRLVDKGIASAAQIGVYGPKRKWLIEGHGVEPDVTVDNLPHATFRGKDAQLQAAIKHLQEEIGKDPRPVPRRPAYPRFGK